VLKKIAVERVLNEMWGLCFIQVVSKCVQLISVSISSSVISRWVFKFFESTSFELLNSECQICSGHHVGGYDL